MKIFALTGGSGVGKTNVARLMCDNGFYIIDADGVAHKVTEQGTQCYDELVSTFGTGIVKKDGRLNRKKLGKLVFGDMDKLKTLNRITHHYILLEIKRIIANLSEYEYDYVGIDGAVILGSIIEPLCEFTVVVDADYDVRAGRIKARDKLSDTEVQKRLMSQPGSEFYTSRADYVIKNNSTLDELKERVFEVCKRIRNER